MAGKSPMTKAEMSQFWRRRIEAADRVKKDWSNRFRTSALYQYYEGFQWQDEPDENNRPYVINMIYSVLESKLPGLIFQNPRFELKPRPTGIVFDPGKAAAISQIKEDVLNYICSERDFGIADKHELAVLDSFFGFGVMEAGCSEERFMNPYLSAKGGDTFYCKHIPFDQFFVAANANWDLSTGRWYGYYEFLPWDRLTPFQSKLQFSDKAYSVNQEVELIDTQTGKIHVNEDVNSLIVPSGHCLIWKLWDFESCKFTLYAPDHVSSDGDAILLHQDFDATPISTLRFGKRRKGWYPLPPVFNWICPQDEVNDIRNTQRIHRKRFARKYAILTDSIDEPELDKFLYGPDGTCFIIKRPDAIKAVEDPPLDATNMASLVSSYDDLHRVSGTPIEERNVGDRTTATQTMVLNKKSQVRDSKDVLRVANFLCDFGKAAIKVLKRKGGAIWYKAQLRNESLIGVIKEQTTEWRNTPATIFNEGDEEVTFNISSISPVSDQVEKTSFMEFLALITQYEILAFSPELLMEAAYRVGYKNQRVLAQFQQWAQLAAIGRQLQLQKMVGVTPGPQPSEPGKMAQEQVAASQGPGAEQIMNAIFNRQPVQQGTQEQ